MKLAIMQPYFFPYIGYFQLLNAVDKFVLYDDVNYIKRGWINRNNILVNSQAYLFTLPVMAASQNKYINEIELMNSGNWKENFLRTVELSYKKAPYFSEVYTLLEDVIKKNVLLIADLVFESLLKVINYLDIKVNLERTSSIYNNKHLKGADRILDICIKEKATHYINPTGGMELYDKTKFSEKGIKLNFIKSSLVPYKQYNNSFVPHLSFIDVMMFNSKKDIGSLLNEYELI